MILLRFASASPDQSICEFQKTPEQIALEIQQKLNLLCVHSADGNIYDVIVQSGGFDSLGGFLRERKLGNPVAVIADETVANLYAEGAVKSIEGAGYKVHVISFPAGEKFKKHRYRYEVVAGDVENWIGSQEHGRCAGRRRDRRPGRLCRVHVHARDQLGGRADHFACDG